MAFNNPPPSLAPPRCIINGMNALQSLALALDPALILQIRGIQPDPWQRNVLRSRERQLLLNCCRQAGKSTVISALALHQALMTGESTILLLSPSLRPIGELFHKVLLNYQAIGRPLKATSETQLKLELGNGARILCLPGQDETIRGFSPDLLVIDEAARVADDLYKSVRPMLGGFARPPCRPVDAVRPAWLVFSTNGKGRVPGSK